MFLDPNALQNMNLNKNTFLVHEISLNISLFSKYLLHDYSFFVITNFGTPYSFKLIVNKVAFGSYRTYTKAIINVDETNAAGSAYRTITCV